MALFSTAELSFLVAFLSICAEDGAPLDTNPCGLPSSQNSLLYGSFVSSAHTLRDLGRRLGHFFVFPDVSIRQRGRYRLKVTLVRLARQVTPNSQLYYVFDSSSSGFATDGAPQIATLTHTYTRVFDVVSRVDYISPRTFLEALSSRGLLTRKRMISAPPLLTTCFIAQGVRFYFFESQMSNPYIASS